MPRYIGNWRSLNVMPTLWPSALGLTREAQYLGIMQQHLSSSEGDRVDWDMALVDRYGPRRSSIWVLANNLRLHSFAGVTPSYSCPQPLLAKCFSGAFGVAIYESRCFQECLVMSVQVPRKSQLTEEYVSVT